MATELTPAENKLLSVCEETIESILGQWNSALDETARRYKDRIMIDSAIGQMWAAIISRPDDLLADVKDLVPVWREAYHYAVNAYFRIYFDRKPGRPVLEEQVCRELLDMRERKMSYGKIALVLKLDKEVVRKRVKACKERYSEGGKNSRE